MYYIMSSSGQQRAEKPSKTRTQEGGCVEGPLLDEGSILRVNGKWQRSIIISWTSKKTLDGVGIGRRTQRKGRKLTVRNEGDIFRLKA